MKTRPTQNTADSTAAIIAAAPDMLAALETIVAGIDLFNPQPHHDNGGPSLPLIREVAAAAIAKAHTPRPTSRLLSALVGSRQRILDKDDQPLSELDQDRLSRIEWSIQRLDQVTS
tara:strand:- start:1044 stop:1391 length:348 start_codon:yes stop_codon:yes gene_type:complete